MFYQRAFSIKKEKLKKSFFLGAAIFAIVPISMGILGFIATGLDMKVPAGLVNYEVIKELLPVWAVYPFLFAVMCGLLSTCDSAMCAASSLAAKDWFPTSEITGARVAMVVLAVISVFIPFYI
jgi:Na+/proline symporter